MANVTSTQIKKFGGGFPGERFATKLVYDFAVDGGAFADAVRIGLAATNCVITESVVHVETACTSGGSATVIIGVEGGDTDAFLDLTSGAVANLVDNFVDNETAGQKIYVASGSYVSLDIGTANLTAGKIAVYLSGYQVA